ncbi:hypothetical protein Bca52824_071223 [Brassica carinata]|uniref:Reverse transcriptase zinc-binding domain-containing protein n=1 Tax=Brassica carinata TaxID=52824 RepID=A0A8X7QAV1_BRACI|nr:hypothetical protein Bca52824_071223 [Brassica carinata]
MHRHRRRQHRIEIFNKVEDEIEKLKHENHQIEDIGLWRSKNGKYKPTFSSKNTWLEIRKVYADQVWSKGVWFKHATPKYSFHTWTAMRDRLSTCDRILKWNPNIDPLSAGHAIWRERNRRKHGDKELPYMLVLKNIDKIVRNRFSTIRRQGDQKMDKGMSIWFGSRV